MEPKRPHSPARRKRILCAVGWWPDAGSVAGIFIAEHIKAIALRHDPLVLYMEVVKGTNFLPTLSWTRAHEDGLDVIRVRIVTRVRRFGIDRLLTRRAYARFIRKLHAEAPFDLVHVHVHTPVTAELLPLAETMHLPMVVTEHNSYYHLGIRKLPAAEQDCQRTALRRWFSSPVIAAVMPVSHDLSRVLHRDYGIPEPMLHVVPNVASDLFRPGSPPAAPPFHIMLAAVWRPPKDHAVFIEALKLLDDDLRDRLRITWAGYGPDMATIQHRCRTELQGVHIEFPGLLDKAAMAGHMRNAHLFVLPTTADNLPCVVLESLCCGTPVLSMQVNGVPELVDAINGMLVPPSDPSALAAALAHMLHHMGSFDRALIARQALARYAPEAVSKAIDAVFDQVFPPSTAGHSSRFL
jgi:glycosyltransferase involved in cell wall biosynthesis